MWMCLCPPWSVVDNTFCFLFARSPHRSRPSSLGQVQREKDAHALQETLRVGAVLRRGMHTPRWDLTSCYPQSTRRSRGICWCWHVLLLCCKHGIIVGWCSVVSYFPSGRFLFPATEEKCVVWWMFPFSMCWSERFSPFRCKFSIPHHLHNWGLIT